MTEYKFMTEEEFKQILKDVGMEFFSWEAILNKISICESAMAEDVKSHDKHKMLGDVVEEYKRRSDAIYEILEDRGYYKM